MKSICYGCMETKEDNIKICSLCEYENIEKYDTYYLPQGTILNEKYLIGKVLGHGGFGITYIAKALDTDQTVAIKEYFPGEYATRSIGEKELIKFTGEAGKRFDEGFSRFFKEGKLLEKYNHVIGIVSALEVFKSNKTAYIVMEYIDGITLEDYLIESGGSIPYESALSIMGPIMDSLKEIHKSGLVHRDISPDNIYITTSGQIKLIDFGAAKQISSNKSKSMSVILKQGYAPEEQYRSKGKQGAWTDVYAVSATIYRMITGEIPTEPMERSIGDDIQKPTAQGIRLPDRIEKTLFKGLAIKAENRYQSIAELQNGMLGNTSLWNMIKTKLFRRNKVVRLEKGKITRRLVNGVLVFAILSFGFVVLRENNARALNNLNNKNNEETTVQEDLVIVPDVRGFSEQDASYIFDELNIIVKSIYDYNEDIEKGNVVSQSYINNYVGKNQLIVLTISKGSKEIITFEDPELEIAVRSAIDKFEEPVYLGDILDVEILEATDKGINSLIGLESFINLRELKLDKNSINRIDSILALPNLEIVHLQENEITTVDLKYAFNKVVDLDLSKNKIKRVSFNSSLNMTKSVNLSGNDITDVSMVQSLKSISKMNFSNNNISTFDFIDSMSTVTELNLSNNDLITMENIAGLQLIERLELQRNDIKLLPDLGNMKELKYLNLSSNDLESVNFSAETPDLRYVDLRENYIDTIVSFKGARNVEELYLQHNKLKTINKLSDLTLVEELSLAYNNINNSNGLNKLKSLRYLDLSYNDLTYLSGMYSLPEVKTIDVSNNKLRSNSGISNLSSLEIIDFSNNSIEAVSMLTNCPNVIDLDLSSNNLTYLRNIYNLKKLENLNLSKNKIVGIYQSLNYNKNLKTLNLYLNNPAKKKYKTSTYFTNLGGSFDLSFVKNLAKLEVLDISYTNAKSLSYLKNLTNLKSVVINGNPIYNTQNQKVVTSLQENGATVSGFTSVQGSKMMTIGNYQYIYGVVD